MKYRFFASFTSSLILTASLSLHAAEFHPPQLLKSGDQKEVIATESPGYAAPCWADIDKDGKLDLLVGQFNGGKIKVYKGLAKGSYKLAQGEWLKTDKGEIVEIPGVW